MRRSKPRALRQEGHRRRAQSSAFHHATVAITKAVEQKGLDVRGLDLTGISDIADCFVIVSGTSQRHVQGIADKIIRALQGEQEKPLSISGYENSEWILLDYGDLVVHIFYEPSRQYYEFDELWNRAREIPLPPELIKQARRLHTERNK